MKICKTLNKFSVTLTQIKQTFFSVHKNFGECLKNKSTNKILLRQQFGCVRCKMEMLAMTESCFLHLSGNAQALQMSCQALLSGFWSIDHLSLLKEKHKNIFSLSSDFFVLF